MDTNNQNVNDMSPERGSSLESFICSVWPLVEVVNFHQGASRTLPYCGIAIKLVIFCRSRSFNQAVSIPKRVTALKAWQENASAVILKEILRFEATVPTKDPKETTAKRRRPSARRGFYQSKQTVDSRTFTAPLTISPRRLNRPTWATINLVRAAEEAARAKASAALTHQNTLRLQIHVGRYMGHRSQDDP